MNPAARGVRYLSLSYCATDEHSRSDHPASVIASVTMIATMATNSTASMTRPVMPGPSSGYFEAYTIRTRTAASAFPTARAEAARVAD